MIRPVTFEWDPSREVMVPQRRFLPLCRRQFVAGEEYPLEQVSNRSLRSHKHYFAALHKAWENLPEKMFEECPSAEHLRHWSLIKLGHFTETFYVMRSQKDAINTAQELRRRDEYAEIIVKGAVVRERKALSQAMPAMGKKQFQETKTEVLELVSSLINVSRAQLEREASHVVPKRRPVRGFE